MSDFDVAEANPYAAPLTDAMTGVFELPESDAIFTLNGMANNGVEYFVLGYSDRLQFRSKKDGQLYEVLRSEPLFVKLDEGFRARGRFRVKLERDVRLHFKDADFETLKEWIGPPTFEDLREAVGGNGWWQLFIAGIYIVPRLLAGQPISLYGSVVAGLLLANWIGGRMRPHRWIFLTIVALFLVFGAQAALHIYQTGTVFSFRILWLLACCGIAWTNFRQFQKYKGISAQWRFAS